MAFWGIELKPGKPVTHSSNIGRRRLRISQATLGIGSSITKALVQCNVGNRSPVFLCALLPDKTESCHLDLEFDEADDVIFSVIGPRTVYLTGYYISSDRHSALYSDTESYGEDIANTETEESGLHSDEDEYEDSFIDDGDPVESPPSLDGDDEEMDYQKKKGSKRLQRKKFVIIDSDDGSTYQESENFDSQLLSSLKNKKAANDKVLEVEEKVTVETDAEPANHVREENVDAVTMPEAQNSGFASVKKKKSKRKREEHSDGELIIEASNSNHKKALKEDKVLQAEAETDNKQQGLLVPSESIQEPPLNMKLDLDSHNSLPYPEKDRCSKKRRKKGSIKERSDGGGDAALEKTVVDDQLKENLLKDEKMVGDLPATTLEDKKLSADDGTNFGLLGDGNQSEKRRKKKKKGKTVDNKENMNVSGSVLSENEPREQSKSCQVRTLSNGLIIEELALGEQEGKIAAIGKKVKVYYTGMLKESGHVFDSNVGRSPYRFRLGDDAVIEGWNIGLEGMHVGDKRRLVIPPSMGYENQGAGENVPPNSWLVYDVELAGVR